MQGFDTLWLQGWITQGIATQAKVEERFAWWGAWSLWPRSWKIPWKSGDMERQICPLLSRNNGGKMGLSGLLSWAFLLMKVCQKPCARSLWTFTRKVGSKWWGFIINWDPTAGLSDIEVIHKDVRVAYHELHARRRLTRLEVATTRDSCLGRSRCSQSRRPTLQDDW